MNIFKQDSTPSGVGRYLLSALMMTWLSFTLPVWADELSLAIQQDYDQHLDGLFDHFHRNPELSLMEHKTAARLAAELRDAGFAVTEGVGGTGVVAIL